jgi:hypothetical protein
VPDDAVFGCDQTIPAGRDSACCWAGATDGIASLSSAENKIADLILTDIADGGQQIEDPHRLRNRARTPRGASDALRNSSRFDRRPPPRACASAL